MIFFFFFFYPNKICPKKLFNDCLFFKEKTPQLFSFAIVYKKKMCNLTKTNHHWLNHLQTLHTQLNYTTSLAVGLRGSSQTLRVTKGNLGLTVLPDLT